MMMESCWKRRWLVTGVVLVVAGPVNAAEITCPRAISIEEKAEVLPDGWSQVQVASGNFLVSMDIAGENGIGLGADQQIKIDKQHYKSVWRLESLAAIGGKKFARCLYTNTKLAIVKPIPIDSRACTVDTKIINGLGHPSMKCE